MTPKNSELSFAGQNIYVGIDAHRNSFTVSIEGDRLFYKTFTQPAKPQVLVDYLQKNFPGATYHSVYEASFCGFWIQRYLSSHGIGCLVVHSCDVPTTSKEKSQKRDTVDSRKLARGLKNGELKGVHVPDLELQQDRSLIRARSSLIANQTRCKNRIKAFLYYYGIEYPESFSKSGTHWSNKFMTWLSSLKLDQESGKQALNIFITEALSLRKLLAEANKNILHLAKQKKYAEYVKLLLSIPGVGRLTAMTILTELGDIKRFKRLDDICCYIGLIPTVYASGEKETIGGISKRGNNHIRRLLIESSWMAVRNDPALGCKYHELCSHMNGNKAIIRIARKLLNRMRFILLNNKPYEVGVAA